jgi:hypothetical protein
VSKSLFSVGFKPYEYITLCDIPEVSNIHQYLSENLVSCNSKKAEPKEILTDEIIFASVCGLTSEVIIYRM